MSAEMQWPDARHNHPLGESCRGCLANMMALEANAYARGLAAREAAYLVSGRVTSMYQNRAKDLGAALLDARGLVRGMDAALDERIDAALSAAGFLSGGQR